MEIAAKKQNEFSYQEKKYAQSTLTAKPFDPLVTPIHRGGNVRGSLRKAALDRLLAQGIEGKRVLDYCCGTGEFANELARRGAKVSAFDVSPNAIKVCQSRATQDVDWRVADAERLPFAEGEFDFVLGIEALHHVIILPRMPAELARICKGPAIFAENWGGDNPLFRLFRSSSLHEAQSDDRGEVILSQGLLEHYLSAHFSRIEVAPLSLTYMAKKYLKSQPVLAALYGLDRLLLKLPLGHWCGESVIELRV